MRWWRNATMAMATVAPPVATAQVAPPPPPAAAAPVTLDAAASARIGTLVAFLNNEGDAAGVFAPSFLAKVPAAQVASITAQLASAGGAIGGIEGVVPASPWQANVRVGYARATVTLGVAIDPAAPHLVTGLLVRDVTAREATIDAVAASLAALPGTTGLVLARLGTAAPSVLKAANADRAFAIGSEFKLVILAELVRAVTAGERRWDDVVTLDGAPLPGGLYTQQPKGTTVPIRALAERMISVSDNSATDILLRTLGRERVEAMLPVVGIARPAGMRPFLGTLEVFKLKGVEGGALGRRWTGLDEAGRRALLAGPVAATPNSAVDGNVFAAGKPLQIETAEWFATPADMVRVMDWLRRNTESGPAAEARAILAKNAGVGAQAASGWSYLGYKGGSEPGVIAMTFLLQGRGGGWYALSGSWNDPAAAVDEARFAGLMTRAVVLAGEGVPGGAGAR